MSNTNREDIMNTNTVEMLENVISLREYAIETKRAADLRDSAYLHGRADEANKEAYGKILDIQAILEQMAKDILEA